MKRAADWEGRLALEVRRAAARAFEPLRWNCARFAHSVAEALLGRGLPFAWRGSLEASVDAVLRERVPVALARRGDIVLADVPEPSLGVCLGTRAAFVCDDGLIERPMTLARIAWRVG